MLQTSKPDSRQLYMMAWSHMTDSLAKNSVNVGAIMVTLI